MDGFSHALYCLYVCCNFYTVVQFSIVNRKLIWNKSAVSLGLFITLLFIFTDVFLLLWEVYLFHLSQFSE
jgi:hypothetical protein